MQKENKNKFQFSFTPISIFFLFFFIHTVSLCPRNCKIYVSSIKEEKEFKIHVSYFFSPSPFHFLFSSYKTKQQQFHLFFFYFSKRHIIKPRVYALWREVVVEERHLREKRKNRFSHSTPYIFQQESISVSQFISSYVPRLCFSVLLEIHTIILKVVCARERWRKKETGLKMEIKKIL